MFNFLIHLFKTRNLIPLGLMVLYLFMPTANSGIDGYAYASAIKWGHEMIWPHHLLYVPFGRILFLLFGFVQPLVLMKLINAIGAGLVLFVFQKILIELQINYSQYFVLFIGSCFGLMRYATENETYILPILFCVLATYYFLKSINFKNTYYLIISSLLFGLGMLFHQIHIFWFLGFATALLLRFDFKKCFLFIAAGGLVVLLVYLAFYHLSNDESDFIKFILHDVYAGQVVTAIGLNNFILTPISFIRTFIQVHGYMKPLLLNNPVLFILPVTFLIIGFLSIRAILLNSKKITGKSVLSNAVLFAFLFQFLFSFYSVGNAEFMVMLPILMTLWVVVNFDIPTKPVFYISIMMLLWNVAFGLSPAHYLDLDGSKQLLAKIDKYPHAKWLLNEPQKIENMMDYELGMNSAVGKFIRPYKNDTLQISFISNLAKDELLTNCLNNGSHFGRQNLTLTSHDFDGYSNFSHNQIDSVEFFGGKYLIEKLSVK